MSEYNEITSPASLKPWSIKETKNDIKVANIFPYEGNDAGEGTFFSLIRTKIKYDSLERDENSNIKINGLKLELEDAVRKICQRKNSNNISPENFLLMTYNFGNINSSDTFITQGSVEKEDFPIESPSLIELENNTIREGFYKGSLISNYNISNPAYKISVVVTWKGKPDLEEWHGTAKIEIINTLIDEVVQTQIINDPIDSTYYFNLPSHMEDGTEIPYKISYEINDLNCDWTTESIQNNIIYFKDKKHSVNIINNWNKIVYNNNKIIAIDIDYKNIDFKNKTVNEFFTYLKTDKAILDWEQLLSKSSDYKKIKRNTIEIFCAQYRWLEYDDEDNIEECFILVPYLSIVIKNTYGISNIYTFHLRSPYSINPNVLLKQDMDNGSLDIIWPYISKREYKTIDGEKKWQIGAESTKLFGRKGVYALVDQGTSIYNKWTNDKDIYYKSPEDNTYNFYIGEPYTQEPNEKYSVVNNSIFYSNVDLKDLNTELKLSNFCIYCVDENCIDETDVKMAIPYYYEAEILQPYKGTGYEDIGVIQAILFFNNKNEYWNINAPDITTPDDPPYKAHEWSSYETDNYVEYKEDFIIPNKEKIVNAAAEDMVDQDFMSVYKKAIN